MQAPGAVVLFDTLTEEHLETIGQLICDIQRHEGQPLFVVGSSGVDYALVKHWRTTGVVSGSNRMPSHPPEGPIPSVDRTVILSGSCSPVSRQISWALEHGFAEVAVETMRLRDPRQIESEIGAIAKQIISLLDGGRSVIAHTIRGRSIRGWRLLSE